MRFAHLFDGVRSVLCVGAHPDDIEIGCGATLLRLRAERPDVSVSSLVMTGSGERAAEAAAAADAFLGDGADIAVLGFRDGHLPWEGSAVKDAFADRVAEVQPDLVLVHQRHDLHQDHRLLAELALQVCRSATILGYEIPKYDGDLGQPNLYVPVSAQQAATKTELLHKVFPSQISKDWFDEATLTGLMRLRGVEARAVMAEAFWAPKLVLP